MSHPMASQAKASQKRRLSKLGGKTGKSWGSSSMYKASGYPSTNAGTERSFTISGGSAKKNAGRKAQKLQTGGVVGGGGAPRPAFGGAGGLNRGRRRGKHKQKNTTNIIIADRGRAAGAGETGARVLPVPVPRPVPVPVGGAAPAPRPVVAAPAAAPVAAPAPAGLPVGGPPVRPPMPGMATGGGVGNFGPGPSYHNWGEGYKSGGVVKKANGGFLKDTSPDGYRGYPHSPTTEVDDAVSAKKDGGAIKKAQFGGLGRTMRRGVQPGGFRPAAVPGTAPGAPGPGGTTSPVVPLTGGARRTRPGYKKGGPVHSDEAEDKKLIAKMIRKEEKSEKRADGGGVGFSPDDQESDDPALIGSKYRQQGAGFNKGGSVKAGKGGGANAYRRKANNASAKSIPAKTEI